MKTNRQFSHLLIPIAIIIAITLFIAPSMTRAFSLPPECANTATSDDTDGDGLSNYEENCKYFTDPNLADTDGDGFDDGGEISNNYSPRHKKKTRLIEVDSDKDGLNDKWELALGTSLMNPDTDDDSFQDGKEVNALFDPIDPTPKKIKKQIDVSTKKLRLTYSIDGKVLGTIPISTGKKSTPTPKGEYKIMSKIPTKHYIGVNRDFPNTKWNLLFTRKNGLGYYIHGAYWHNQFGKSTVSGGCVNVRYEDMERLYKWAGVGTPVHIE